MADKIQTLSLSIVIPAHHEPNLSRTLEDLNKAAEYSGLHFRVYVILNESERASHQVKEFHADQQKRWSSNSFNYELIVLHCASILHKKAGVGYARKYGLEKAIRDRSASPNHILIWLDADCELPSDYISGWAKVFLNSDIDAAVMQFEHKTDAESPILNRAILEYEAHLRYYHHLQAQLTYPHAMQPIGSCIGVRSSFYEKVGGMSPRKAGEDFYFLQKCMLNGRAVHANNTRIFPSNRISKRVPFGTGRAMMERLDGYSQMTYDYACMPILQQVISTLRDSSASEETILNKLPTSCTSFFQKQGLIRHWKESHKHTRTEEAFENRIFRWFHPFRFMKLMHHLRDTQFPPVPLKTALRDYFQSRGLPASTSSKQALQNLRRWGEQDGLWQKY
jgi:hypothetical protein